MFWDTHMHCNFSGDCDSTPQSMIEAAITKGLSGICFTDHMDYDYPTDPHHPTVFEFDPDEYNSVIHTLQRQYDGRLPILYGIELGLQPHLAKRHKKLLQDYSFDFVIGSSHVVDGKDPYYASYYEGRSDMNNTFFPYWKISVHFRTLTYMDILTMLFATGRIKTLFIPIRNMQISLMKF